MLKIQILNYILLVVGLGVTLSNGLPTEKERRKVKEWDDMLVSRGYDYEIYYTETDDEWLLTLFRILRRPDIGKEMDPNKPPILLMHGDYLDAAAWLTDCLTRNRCSDKTHIALDFVEHGYDVWMGNNRGTRYSNVNRRYPNAEDTTKDWFPEYKAKWDFSFMEQGTGDLPVFIDKMREVRGDGKKVIYLGEGMSNAQLLYGLTQMEEEYFADVLDRAIMMAPCLFVGDINKSDYETVFKKLKASKKHTFMSEMGVITPVKNLEHHYQMSYERRLQHFAPEFSQGKTKADLWSPGLESIDKVPIYFLLAGDDEVCTLSDSMEILEQINSAKKYVIFPLKPASFFRFNQSFVLLNEIARTMAAEPDWSSANLHSGYFVRKINFQPAVEYVSAHEDFKIPQT